MGKQKKIVLSGMRPSGRLHIGHLHGALTNWISMQEDYDCYFFSADWHALTTEYADTGSIRPDTAEMIADWLAVGLDPDKSVIFVQSHIKEHAELCLLLSMITPVPWLERNPTYKEQRKQIRDRDLSTHGFLGYPCLQAADIIIYRAHYVPVGSDQVPHVELTREIARRFNHFYGEVFPVPEPLLTKVPKIPGTDGRKMSKSYGNAITLADAPEEIKQKLSTMITDPARKRRTDPGDPDKCPVYDLHRVYSAPETLKWAAEGCCTAGIGCLECKAPLIEAVNGELEPIRERRARISADPGYVSQVIAAGDARAKKEAEQTMRAVREAMKLD